MTSRKLLFPSEIVSERLTCSESRMIDTPDKEVTSMIKSSSGFSKSAYCWTTLCAILASRAVAVVPLIIVVR